MKEVFEIKRKSQLQRERKYAMRQIITFLILGILTFSIFQNIYAQKPSLQKDTEKPLKLILAVDVSGSVKPFWPSIMAAIFACIDDLKIDDKVLPVAFGTVARTLSEPITVRSGAEKLQLREIFSKLRPVDSWTYFADLIKVTENIARSEPDWVLLVFSDCRSDPGPGRIRDVEITRLASAEKLFQNGGVFVIRLLPNQDLSDSKFLNRLREDEEELKAGGVISTVAVDSDLIKLIHEFIPLLKKDIELAKALLEEKSEAFKSFAISTSSPDKSKTTNPEVVGEEVEVPSKNEISSGKSNKSPAVPAQGKKDVAKITEPQVSKKHDEKTGKNTELYSPPKKSSPFLQKTVKKLKNFGLKFLIFMKKSLFWILGIAIILIVIIALFRAFPLKKEVTKDRKDSEQTELKFNKEDECYSLVVKADDVNPASYPLIPEVNFIIGTDIPIPSVDKGIAILKVKKNQFILEPLVESLTVNGFEAKNSVELFPGDVIRFEKASIEIITEEVSNTGEMQDSFKSAEDIYEDQIDEEESDIDLSDEDFSLG